MSPFFIGLPLICALGLTAALVRLKLSFYQKAVSLIFLISCMLWLQANMLVWDYGLLDGREIDWSEKIGAGLIDSVLWITAIIIGIVWAAHVCRIAQKGSVAFILIQLISTLFVVTQVPEANRLHKEPLGKEESFFKFSQEKNVIILVLDSFQGDIFNEIINESPPYRDYFQGFTYYRNALSGFPHTGAAVPLILTGRFYENSIPFHEFKKNAFSLDSVPKILKSNGYQVDLVGPAYFFHADSTVASSRIAIKDLIGQNVRLKDAAFTFDVSLFRHIPHFTKMYVYNNQSWLFSNWLVRDSGPDDGLAEFPAGFHRDDIRFVRKMALQAKGDSDRPTFKYIHIKLPHLPVRINEQLEYGVLPGTRNNFKKQAKATLTLVSVFLDTLKDIGAYDTSMIFVLADHGAYFPVKMREDPVTNNRSREPSKMDRIKARASVIFLRKPFESAGEMKISDVPVSLSDVARTVISDLGFEAEVPGVPISMLTDAHSRNRRFLDHSWYMNFWEHDYFPPMEEYRIMGYGWLEESWHPTHTRFTSEAKGNIQ